MTEDGDVDDEWYPSVIIADEHRLTSPILTHLPSSPIVTRHRHLPSPFIASLLSSHHHDILVITPQKHIGPCIHCLLTIVILLNSSSTVSIHHRHRHHLSSPAVIQHHRASSSRDHPATHPCLIPDYCFCSTKNTPELAGSQSQSCLIWNKSDECFST